MSKCQYSIHISMYISKFQYMYVEMSIYMSKFQFTCRQFAKYMSKMMYEVLPRFNVIFDIYCGPIADTFSTYISEYKVMQMS